MVYIMRGCLGLLLILRIIQLLKYFLSRRQVTSPIATNSKFIISLDEPVKLSNDWSKYFRIYNIPSTGSPEVIGIGYPNRVDHVSLSGDGRSITFTPHAYSNTGEELILPTSSTISLQIKAGAFKDLNGNNSSQLSVNVYNFLVESVSSAPNPNICHTPPVPDANYPHNQSSIVFPASARLVTCKPGYKILAGARFLCSATGVLSGSPECVVDEYYGSRD